MKLPASNFKFRGMVCQMGFTSIKFIALKVLLVLGSWWWNKDNCKLYFIFIMKKTIQLFVLVLNLFNHSSLNAQAGNWQWAKTSVEITPPGTFTDQGWSISADHSGNSYITGFFNSPNITFGSTTLT